MIAVTDTLPELLAGLVPETVAVPQIKIRDIVLDSRQVAPGSLFLACAGNAHHGLEYARAAVQSGAAAIAWEPVAGVAAPELAVQVISVPELRAHAGEIAARFFGRPGERVDVTGITGTDGKTSTAYLLTQAFTFLGLPCGYVGTLGAGLPGLLEEGLNTTPDPVSLQRLLAGMADAGCQQCALEVSSIALDQGRVNGLPFAATVLTNISRDHLDYHHTMQAYIAAKRSLFGRGDGAVAILNHDDAQGRAFAASLAAKCRVVSYGFDDPVKGSAYVQGQGLVTHARGLSFKVVTSQTRGVIDSRLLGRFNAWNLLAAAAVLAESGMALDEACAALSNATTVPGRAEAFSGPCAEPLVVVDYAHTPQALKMILLAMREHAAGRLVCVFGCGGDRDRGKRPQMGKAVAECADAFVITNDNPRSENPQAIVDDIRAGFPADARYEVCLDRAEAIRTAVAQAQAGDIVIVAGKGHEPYQIVGNERLEFSDRALAAELVGMELAA